MAPVAAAAPSPTDAALSGRRVLVTGAASGIGRATAALFVAAGARVALVDYNLAAVGRIAEAILFLTARTSSHVNGATLVVDGGYSWR